MIDAGPHVPRADRNGPATGSGVPDFKVQPDTAMIEKFVPHRQRYRGPNIFHFHDTLRRNQSLTHLRAGNS